MSTTAQLILLIVVVFYIGLFIGFVLRHWLQYRTGYDGAMVITKTPEKTLYSLELDDDVDMIEFKKELILKVKTPE